MAESKKARVGAARRAFDLNIWAFAIVAIALVLVSLATSSGVWWFWPVLIWGIIVMVHYLYVRTLATDDAWADRRAEELADKAYDFGHMEDIRERYGGERPTGIDDKTSGS